jgi:tetratricopeptide (TPR) repeat protein
MYALGAAHGLRASHAMLVRKAWLDALRGSNEARGLHNRVARLDPSNVDARMMQGVNDYVVATLPRGVRWLASIIGVKGDKQKGLAALAEVAARGRRNREDARILLATVYRHEKMGHEAVRMIERLESDYPRNTLFGLARVYTLLDAGERAGAWRALGEMEGRVAAAKMLYARGYLEMRGGELAAAASTLERAAVAAGREDRLTRMRSLVRLGQIHDLRGERELAKQSYRSVVEAAPGTRCGNESREYLARPYHGGETD